MARIAYNRYPVEKEKLVVSELEAGKSFRVIEKELKISMNAIQRIKADYKVVQPVKEKVVYKPVKRSEYKQQSSSHVPLTHVRNGESFIYEAF